MLLVGEARPRHGTRRGQHAVMREVAALYLLLLPHGDRLRLQRVKGASRERTDGGGKGIYLDMHNVHAYKNVAGACFCCARMACICI